MSFNIFAKEVTGSADEVNDNFEHIASGDRLPMTGNSLTSSVAGTFDLGEQDTRWNTAYVNNIDMTGELTKAFNLISEITLTTTAASLSFTGLDGDTDEVYILNVFCIPVTNSSIYMFFNQDSAANYGTQFFQGLNAAVSAARATGQQGINFSRGANTTGADISNSEMIIYAKSGHERTALITNSDQMGTTGVLSLREFGAIWNNTSSNTVSIQINGALNYFDPGTNVQLWAKR